MEQLFGSSASTVLLSRSKDMTPFDIDWEFSNTLLVDKNSKVKVKEDNDLFSESRNLNRHSLQRTTLKPGVKTCLTLGLAGMELTFPGAARTVLCSAIVAKRALVSHQCFVYY